MKNLIILVIGFCLVLGCRSKKEFTQNETTTKIDTLYVQNKTVDTVIITKEKEITKPVYFETEIPCNENQKGKVGSGGNYTNYVIEDGKIYLQTKLDSVSNNYQSFYRSKFKQDSINLRKHFERELSQQEKVKVYVYPWWIYVIIIAGIISIALNIYQKFKPV